ncbi:riboflavin synthase [Fodinicurvata sp. EGI_FJ10296]|uniref:riboflavin synthase n=1 Tax=Fodinicurvata sp. EGI_FJ10296 TaxID=3231908 RepID=UPI003455E70C
MFTGIITDVGRIGAVDAERGGKRFYVATSFDVASIDLGASIAHNGCCLTVVEKGSGWYAVDVSAETMARTTLGDWQEDTRLNLERSLKLGDELGGHLVYGHVDCVALVSDKYADGDSWRLAFDIPGRFGRFVASKGSVALDGVSLTVNEVDDTGEMTRFGVNIIPHTFAVTTFGDLSPGHRVNFEADMLARYVARLTETGAT